MKRKRALLALAVLPLAAYLGSSLAQMRQAVPVTPPGDALFTSTASVTSLAIGLNDELWAGTTGGILHRGATGLWKKYTRRNGLSSNEVQQIQVDENGILHANLPRAVAVFKQNTWEVSKAVIPPNTAQAVEIEWRGNTVQATPSGLRIRQKKEKEWKPIALPASRGSHVSAMMIKGGQLWLALYGDGVWSYDGTTWHKPVLSVPEAAQDTTALAFDEKTQTLWLGTRRGGIWQYVNSNWQQYRQPDEPLEHNAQRLAFYDGSLYMSTLEDGLQKRSGQGWQQVSNPTLSSGATRCLVPFGGKLYVRHGGGKVDAFDGRDWTTNVFPQLPRQKAFAMAADSHKMLIAQWGGWSEWDGKQWAHFLRIPELQGIPVMAIFPMGDKVWLGTQSRGVGEYSRSLQTFRWHDERHGLPDDWITCFSRSGNTLFIGTFVGGLARFDGKRWHAAPELTGDNVTDLRSDSHGNLFIATRRGIWQRDKAGALKKLNNAHPWLDTEAQALWSSPQGLWIGLRTGVAFLQNKKE